MARAHALTKKERFEEAKRDADKAIDVLRSEGATSPLVSKAFLRSGVTSFHLGRYKEARNCFVEGERVQVMTMTGIVVDRNLELVPWKLTQT